MAKYVKKALFSKKYATQSKSYPVEPSTKNHASFRIFYLILRIAVYINGIYCLPANLG
jgi:hypothetical protein